MPYMRNKHGQVIHAEDDLVRVLAARGYEELPDPVLEARVQVRAELTADEQTLVDQVIAEETPPVVRRPKPRKKA